MHGIWLRTSCFGEKMDDCFIIRAYRKDGCRGDLCRVTIDSPLKLRRIVENFARYLHFEERYDFTPFDAEESVGYTAYLFGEGQFWVGACVFSHVKACAPGVPEASWILAWIWVHPFCRRRGVLTRAWKRLEAEHGLFLLQSPLSYAMDCFCVERSVADERIVHLG